MKVVQRMATPHTMCPRASVSRMKYTPLVRTDRPKTTASSTATSTPPPADTQKPCAWRTSRMAVVYAATAKNPACPMGRIPV